MSKFSLSLVLLILGIQHSNAQSMQFFEYEYDFGDIMVNQQFQHRFYFTNNSDSVLVISSTFTGDGGTMASFPKEPIMSGDSAYITFYVNTSGRYGRWTKQILINSNLGQAIIRVNGFIIRPNTKIRVSENKVKLKPINFGNLDTAVFQIINSGKELLYINSSPDNKQNEDIYLLSLQGKQSEYLNYYSSSYYPGDTFNVQIIFRNCFGNTGDFKRTIQLLYNNHDTLELSIEGKYVANNVPEILYERYYIYYYKNKQLYKIKKLNNDGSCNTEKYFQNGECIQVDSFDWRTQQLSKRQKYKNGQLIKD